MKRIHTFVLSILIAGAGITSSASGIKVHRHAGGIAQAVTLAERVALGKPSGSLPSNSPQRAAAAPILTEDFSKCTEGTEAAPSEPGTVGQIPAALTGTEGWIGATFHQAGGCAFLSLYAAESNGTTLQVSLLDTPVLGLGSDQTIVEVRFRARAKEAGNHSFYIVNADASTNKTLSTVTLGITGEWAEYTAVVTGCNRYSFLEFQTENCPFYIDDISVSAVEKPAKPQVLPATEISASGFTANWSTVDDVTGYILSPKVLKTSDGMSPRYMLDTDFDAFTEGTVDNPVSPQYSVYSLDDYLSQKGWLARLPYFAKGALGLSNQLMSTYGNSLLQSPTLNLSGDGGRLTCKMRFLAKDVDMFQVNIYQVLADGRVSLRSTKQIYTQEEYDIWKDLEFSMGGGTASSMIVIILPETTNGTVFFDSLSFSQMLPEGTRYSEPMSTINTETNHARVETPNSVPEDSYSYSVTGYRRVADGVILYSDASNEIIVGQDSDTQPESLGAPKIISTTVDGGRFTATWEAVKDANAYRVDVYRRHTSNGLETVDIINENFDGIIVGTSDLDHPRAMSMDGYDRLDDYTKVPGWEVFQGFYVDGAVGILGYWNMLGVGCYMRSPVFDLSANGGNMQLDITVGSDYYNQGATVYLAHENPETGGIVYDDILPLDEMEKGFHDFSTQFKNGRKDSFFVFYPYGYGLSYFDNIRVRQQLPEGTHDYKVTSRTVSGTSATLSVPDIKDGDTYYYTVTALWNDTSDLEKVGSDPSAQTPIEGLQPTISYSGKVTDMEGNPIEGAVVSVMLQPDADSVNSEITELHTGVTNRWGLFRIDNIVTAGHMHYNSSAKAQGYLSAIMPGGLFTDKNVTDVEVKLRKASSDTEIEIGMPTGLSATGAAYLQYNNSESETIYPAEAIGVPKGARITSIAYDGCCDTEKDVNYRMELYVENTSDEMNPTSFSPRDLDKMTRFDSGTRKISKAGSLEEPVEMVRFTNDEGFEYTGGNLRVRMSSRSNKTNFVYFLVDGSREKQSMYRNWSSTESNEWNLNTQGMPVIRVDYDASGVGVETVGSDSGNGLKAEGLKGAIRFTASEAAAVNIYSVDGICIATLEVTPGVSVCEGIAPGLYIAAGTKVIVR